MSQIVQDTRFALRMLRKRWGITLVAVASLATAIGRNDGATKIIADPSTKRILGVGIAGVGASELIAEAGLAIEMGATTTDIGRCIHPHPTLSETIAEGAELAFGTTTHQAPQRR